MHYLSLFVGVILLKQKLYIVFYFLCFSKKDIAAANFTMHEVHCRRHLVLCDHCKEPVPRSELEQHFNDVHAKVACTQCAMELEKDHVDEHMVCDSVSEWDWN